MKSSRSGSCFVIPAFAVGLRGALAAVLVAACGASPHAWSAPPPNPAATPLDFPKPLTDTIKKVDAEKDPQGLDRPQKKAKILWAAYDALPNPFTSKTAVWKLLNPGDYVFDTSKKTSDPAYYPKYFATKFSNKKVTVEPDQNVLYDYRPNEVWVDFANEKLGGGVFGNGMVQEETMALSMPQLADAAAIGYLNPANGYYTRSKGQPGPLGSSPTPLVLTDVYRTIALDQALYGNGWVDNKNITKDNIVKNYTTVLKPNQDANILAVAVEKLDGTPAQQTAFNTLDDLFNTFVAAYIIANQAKPNTTINTGPIGTGDFKNDPQTIYVMQHLAAQQIGGLNLRYWALDPTKQQQPWDGMVNKIINNWNSDTADQSITRLIYYAHECLTASQKCK
jgi:hypothetical protein